MQTPTRQQRRKEDRADLKRYHAEAKIQARNERRAHLNQERALRAPARKAFKEWAAKERAESLQRVVHRRCHKEWQALCAYLGKRVEFVQGRHPMSVADAQFQNFKGWR